MTEVATRYRLKISQDHDAEAPRWDPVSRFVTWHRGYTIGDEQPKEEPLDYMLAQLPSDVQEQIEQEIRDYPDTSAVGGDREWEEWCREFTRWKAGRIGEEFDKLYIYLPVHAYIHSGITISTGTFSCPWDSGQLGLIYISKESAAKEWNANEEKALEYLDAEIKVYDQYLQGNVWGFQVHEVQVCNLGHEHLEDTDSCWGFYADSWEECRDQMAEHFEPVFTDEEWEKAWDDRSCG